MEMTMLSIWPVSLEMLATTCLKMHALKTYYVYKKIIVVYNIEVKKNVLSSAGISAYYAQP